MQRSLKLPSRQLHGAGVLQNYGPRAARTRRELARITSNVRKVLWRKPGRLILWVDRDWPQARANGASWWGTEKLTAPYAGRIVFMGGRALLILTGRAPA